MRDIGSEVGASRKVLVIFVALMAGNAMAALDTTMVATATPTIVGDLGGLRDLAWIATAYLLTAMAVTPLYGKLGDMYGRKRIFLVAIAIFLTGSVLCGLAGSMTELIAFRAIQGIGAGGLTSLPMAMVADLVPARDLGRWIGYSGFVFAFASVAGPLFGGLFAQHVSWRWAFLVNIPVGLLSAAVVWRRLDVPSKTSQHRIDWLGAALLIGAVSCLVLLTSWGGSREDWDSPTIVALGAGVLALMALFVLQERRAPEPILPPRLFKISIARTALALNLTAATLFFAALYFVSAFLQYVNGISPTASGLYMIPLMFSTVTGTVLVGRLIDRTGHYRRYPIRGACIVIVGLLLLVRLDAGSSALEVMLSAAVLGFGLGLIMQVLILVIQNAVEPRDLGVATSTSMFNRQMGGAVGLALLGSIFTAGLTHWLPILTPGGAGIDLTTLRGRPETLQHLGVAAHDGVVEAFARSLHTVFLVCVPIAVIVLILAIRLKEIPLRGHTSSPGDDLAVALEGSTIESGGIESGTIESGGIV
jgi:EmrB/QacA subfamily drug resistance transporter